ncbi:hypothetical protein B484DRAFT_448057 [Ochromonadaceae sp. CCMP2298]|nr:hypothetical protein B484DRAFT_448057 [Ochromonadaceae sp. CCMP2298]
MCICLYMCMCMCMYMYVYVYVYVYVGVYVCVCFPLPRLCLHLSTFTSPYQYFPPSDLSQFQSTYGLPQQTAEEVGGHVSDAKCVEDADNCGEANLDMQYLMAVSQAPTSYGTCLTQTGS